MQLLVDGADIFAATGGRDFDRRAAARRVRARRRARSYGLGAAGALVCASRLRRAGARPAGTRPLRRRAARLHRRHGGLDRGADRGRRSAHRAASSAIPWDRSWRSRPPRATRSAVNAIALIGAAAAMPVCAGSAQRSQGQRSCGDRYDVDLGIRFSCRPWRLARAGTVDARKRRAPARTRAPGVLFKDLSACNDYRDGLTLRCKVSAPATLILGERDVMTPAKPARACGGVAECARGDAQRRRPYADERAAGRGARRAAWAVA